MKQSSSEPRTQGVANPRRLPGITARRQADALLQSERSERCAPIYILVLVERAVLAPIPLGQMKPRYLDDDEYVDAVLCLQVL